ncbi:EST1 family protein [Schizosaccharomyces pombe]|uniref:Uncharacterized serine-rich protein C2F12.03c n=1 Tax=Schizosaccharomyces pombe (strain 972 / ATCC 24843) TaxID=284812 RepID=YB33_SCHPO|nr:putative EST1 family protein [Schizosaccharomyces pombe]O14338.1 RecName: Full=Uncharacterized serine-rich protein C2F12.03c [Schizosaccharomyces pombe 972h-]CAB10152.1 EST1 family protein (predicted) [Schizosaccharomyces pombe]|eukprot:NP_595712.1 putative EST1 family protein [Schizosaccharomyces pombe]
MSAIDSCEHTVSWKLCEQKYNEATTLLSKLKKLLGNFKENCTSVVVDGHKKPRSESRKKYDAKKQHQSSHFATPVKGVESSEPTEKKKRNKEALWLRARQKKWKEIFELCQKITSLLGGTILIDVSFSMEKDVLTYLWMRVHYQVISFFKHRIYEASTQHDPELLSSLVTMHIQYLNSTIQFYTTLIAIIGELYHLQCLSPLTSFFTSCVTPKTILESPLRKQGSHNWKTSTNSQSRLAALFSSIFEDSCLEVDSVKRLLSGSPSSSSSPLKKDSSSNSLTYEPALTDHKPQYLVLCVYRSLIYIGDVHRYLAEVRSPNVPDYQVSRRYYVMAANVAPDYGVHFHQLGLIEVADARSSSRKSSSGQSSSLKGNVNVEDKRLIQALPAISFFFLSSISPNNVAASSAKTSLFIALKRCFGKTNDGSNPCLYHKESSAISLFLRLYAIAFSNTDADYIQDSGPLFKRVRFLLSESLKSGLFSESSLLQMTYCALAARVLAPFIGFSDSGEHGESYPNLKLATQTTTMFFEVLSDSVNSQLPLQALTSGVSSKKDGNFDDLVERRQYGSLSSNAVLMPMLLPLCVLTSSCLQNGDVWLTKDIRTGLSQIFNRLSFFLENTNQTAPDDSVLVRCSSKSIGLLFFFPLVKVCGVPRDTLQWLYFSNHYPFNEEGKGPQVDDSDALITIALDSLYVLLNMRAKSTPNSTSFSSPPTPHRSPFSGQAFTGMGLSNYSLMSSSSFPSAQSSPTSPFLSGTPSIANQSSSIASLQFGRMVDSLVGPVQPIPAQTTGCSVHSLQQRTFSNESPRAVDSGFSRTSTPFSESTSSYPLVSGNLSSCETHLNGSPQNGHLQGERVLFRPLRSPALNTFSTPATEPPEHLVLSELLKKMVNISNN